MNPAYRHVRFRAELPHGGLPVRFGIVTACNPDGGIQPDAENEARTRELGSELRTAGVPHFPVTGGSPDFSHAEPGYGVLIDRAGIVALGRRWKQDAVFWVERQEVWLVPCGTGDPSKIGAWPDMAESPVNAPGFHFVGNPSLLEQPKTALFASTRCPGAAILRAQDQALRWREEKRCIISGFHSPVEQECLRVLLRGQCPVIVCLARAIPARLPEEWRKAVESGAMLVVSPFSYTTTRISAMLAQRRNEFVAALADDAWFAHVTKGGASERLFEALSQAGRVRV